jgi:hypothetical protein
MITEDLHGVQGAGVVDTAFNDHIDLKVIPMQIKELLAVIDFDQFHAVAAPELLQKEFFLFSND